MTYFVTGATGFIGRHLVERLLEPRRRHPRARPRGLPATTGSADRPVGRAGPRAAGRGRPRPAAARPDRQRRRTPTWPGEALLPPRGDLRHDRGRGAQPRAQRRRHPARRRPRQRARGRLPAPRVVDRRGRRVQGPVPRGHVRRGAAAAVAVPPHEVRVRTPRARPRDGAVARLPPRRRRRPLADRRDGQDRRALLLLQGDPARAALPAGVVPADRPRDGLDQHRAGRLRRRPRSTTSRTSTASTGRRST